MAIKIDGTRKVDSGGWGLGSLLGKIVGGAAGIALAPVTGGASLAAGLTGAGIGGQLGGAAGGMIDPGKDGEAGINVAGAKSSGFGQDQKPKMSAIDRLNSVLDTGTTIAGAANTLSNLGGSAPKIGGPSAIQRRLSNFNQMNSGY